jgi:hypothetical protein
MKDDKNDLPTINIRDVWTIIVAGLWLVCFIVVMLS